MNADQFVLLKKILLETIDLSEKEREEYLDNTCSDDPELRSEVESILTYRGHEPGILKTDDKIQEERDDHLIGQTVAHYRITAVLGAGGMGVVYKAEDMRLRRPVALKFLPPDLARDTKAKPRFVREAQAAASLDHPSICTVYEIGGADGKLFIAMAYVQGETLRKKLSSGRLKPEEALFISKQIAEGLQAAHEKGIIHRDIKPGNIMVTEKGHVKIMDFGLAKLTGRHETTQPGTLMGTVSYMSPEQAKGYSVDHRTDIWSLGVLLYEMITGQRPFEAEHEQAILYLILNRDPEPISRLCGSVPMELERIVGRALAKIPDGRYQSIGDMLKDIEAVRHKPRLRSTLREEPPRGMLEGHAALGPSDLPVPLKSFIGRYDEVLQVKRLLQKSRLVVILGPGGFGKSRLAIQVATELVGAFRDGVFFIPLAPITSVEFMLLNICASLGVTLRGGESETVQLLDFLRGREILLVLDRFEHLLEGAELVKEMLRCAPEVKVLVTSRERVGIPGESPLVLDGLRFPGLHETEHPETYDAVRFFIQGARDAQPDFPSQEKDWERVATACRLLGGVPLAIELASSWLSFLSCKKIVAKVEKSVKSLARDAQGVPERVGITSAIIGCSWKLVSAKERKALKRMGIFRSGFQKKAAEAIAGAPPHLVTALVEKSFLRVSRSDRYEMHDFLGSYAMEKLGESPKEMAKVLDLHCAYYAGFLREREEEMKGSTQGMALYEIAEEIEDVRFAWSTAIEGQDTERIRDLLGGLSIFYDERGWYHEAEETFGTAVQKLRDARGAMEETDLILGETMGEGGVFACRLGRYAEARELLQEGISILRGVSASDGLKFLLLNLGFVAQAQGKATEAKHLYTEGLAISQELGDQRGEAFSLCSLAGIALLMGEDSEAERLGKKSLVIFHELGDFGGISLASRYVDHLHVALGEFPEPDPLLRKNRTP